VAPVASRAHAVRAGRVEGPREETSLLAFLSIILMHRRLIILWALAGTALFGVISAASANLYLSRASFVIRNASTPVQVPGGEAALRAFAQTAEFQQSVNFYSDLVKAKSVLYPIAEKTYVTSTGEKKTLAQVYGIDAKDARTANTLAGDRLISDVSSSIYSRSGVIGVAVHSTDPLVAQQIAGNILIELDSYGSAKRHQQTVAERQFVEQLLREARARLDAAEQSVSTFLRLNREYEGAPQLRLAHDRLTRNVMMEQQIYTALQQSYAQAKIEEVRDPTTLNVVEPPDLPAEPERRTAVRQTLLGLAVGTLVGIVIAFLRQRALETKSAGTSGWLRYSNALKT
jgi:uncharacterized protein involved in exopolysaccharide biosynthesis